MGSPTAASLSVPMNHLESLLKPIFHGPSPKDSESVRLGGACKHKLLGSSQLMLMVPSWEQCTLWSVDLQSKCQQRNGQIWRLTLWDASNTWRTEKRGETTKVNKKEISRAVNKRWHPRSQMKKCFEEDGRSRCIKLLLICWVTWDLRTDH